MNAVTSAATTVHMAAANEGNSAILIQLQYFTFL